MEDSLPALAQRVTVLGSTRNSAATSAGVSKESSLVFMCPPPLVCSHPARTEQRGAPSKPSRGHRCSAPAARPLGSCCKPLRRPVAPYRFLKSAKSTIQYQQTPQHPPKRTAREASG